MYFSTVTLAHLVVITVASGRHSFFFLTNEESEFQRNHVTRLPSQVVVLILNFELRSVWLESSLHNLGNSNYNVGIC